MKRVIDSLLLKNIANTSNGVDRDLEIGLRERLGRSVTGLDGRRNLISGNSGGNSHFDHWFFFWFFFFGFWKQCSTYVL